MRKLGVNTIVLSGSSVLAQGLLALTFWLVARSLTPAELGSVTAAIGVATLLLTALDFGINSLTIRQLARNPHDLEVFSSTLGAKVVTSGGVGLAWMLVVGAVAIANPAWWSLVPLGAYIALSDIASTLTVVARSREQMHISAITQIVQKAACLIATSAALYLLADVRYAFPLGLVLGSAASVGVAIYLLDPECRTISRPTPGSIAHLWRTSAGFGWSGLAAQVQRVDIAIVAALAGPAAAGLYAAPSRLTNLLTILPTALSAALFPRVAGASGRGGKARRDVLMAIGFTLALSTLAMAIIFSLADWIVPLLLGDDYRDSVPVLRAFLIGLVCMCANAPLAALLQAEGYERYVAKVVGAASIVGLIAIAIGALSYGAVGAAAGYIALQICILVPLILFLSREHHGQTQKGVLGNA